MKIPQIVLFAVAALRLKVRPGSLAVTCSNCPNWIPQTPFVEQYAGGQIKQIVRAGVCALDRPRIFNDIQPGYALKCWTARDFCSRHPLHDPNLIGHHLPKYRPGAAGTEANAGFERVPSIAEALKIGAIRAKVTPQQLEAFAKYVPASERQRYRTVGPETDNKPE